MTGLSLQAEGQREEPQGDRPGEVRDVLMVHA